MSKIEFILPTCTGIPDAIWAGASAFLHTIIAFSTEVLLLVLIIGVVKIMWQYVENGNADIRRYITLLFHMSGVIIFLQLYPKVLYTFDLFIDLFCPKLDIKDPHMEAILEFKYEGWLTYVKAFFSDGGSGIFKAILLAFNMLAVYLVKYLRSISLIILVQFGPIAAMLTLLPGPFRKCFSVWAKSYTNVSCWAITLNMFLFMVNASYFSSTLAKHEAGKKIDSYVIILVVLFFAVLKTPSWTSMVINGVTSPDVMGGIGRVAEKIGSPKQLMKMVGGMFKVSK